MPPTIGAAVLQRAGENAHSRAALGFVRRINQKIRPLRGHPDAQTKGMEMSTKPQRFMSRLAWSAAVAALAFAAAPANAAEPIKIGLGMSLTGPLAANGKMSLVAMQVWEDDVNAKGGLARPAGPARLLRRSEQSVASPRHLRQAARCRQSRSDRQRLCLDPDRRGDAGRDPEQEAVRQPVRHRHQRHLPL